MNSSTVRFPQSRGFKSEAFYLIIAILIPLALAGAWHQRNTVIPNDDSGNYFETAERIYGQFHHSVLNGIVAAYKLRGWRPILFPVLAVPFIAITGNNILASVALTLLFLYAVTLIYLFLLARHILPPERACLATLFVAGVPWVFQSVQYFMSEIAMILCAVATVYHFKRSELLTRTGSTILTGLCVAVGIMVRPVEFTLSFFIPVVCILLWCRRSRTLKKNDLLMSIGFSSIAAILLGADLLFPTFLPIWVVFGLCVLILNLASVLAFETLQLNLTFGTAFFFCHFLCLAWWLPQMRNLYDWVHLTTGSMAANYHNQGEMSTLRAVEAFFVNLGGYPLMAVVALLIISILLTRKIDLRIYKQFTGAVALAIAMILPPVVALSLTPDIAYRRGFIGFCFFFVAVCTYAVHPQLSRGRLQQTLMLVFVVAQFSIASLFTFDLSPRFRTQLAYYWGYVGIPLVGGDPSTKTLEKLAELPLENMNVAVLTHSLQDFPERPFDPPAMKVAAVKAELPITFGYPVEFTNLAEAYKQLIQYDYILLDVSTVRSALPQNDTPYTRLTEDFIERWRTGQIEKTGFKPVTEFEIAKARTRYEKEKTKKIILLTTRDSENPGFSMKENVALSRYGGVPGSTSPDASGFPIANLNDGDESTVWGSAEVSDDTIFYIRRSTPYRAKAFKVVLFTMPNGGHIRDVSVAATNTPSDPRSWKIIRSRITDDAEFDEKITIPEAPDRSVVTIQLDNKDPNWVSFNTYGLACFSKSHGYRRNYVSVGTGIYVREFKIAGAEANQ